MHFFVKVSVNYGVGNNSVKSRRLIFLIFCESILQGTVGLVLSVPFIEKTWRMNVKYNTVV
jgi:hypothetical protein